MDVLISGTGRPYLDGETLDLSAPVVFTIDNVLSPVECRALVARIDALGPTVAPITTSRGPEMRTDIRNNLRVIFDDVELARELYARVAPAIPTALCGLRACGAN